MYRWQLLSMIICYNNVLYYRDMKLIISQLFDLIHAIQMIVVYEFCTWKCFVNWFKNQFHLGRFSEKNLFVWHFLFCFSMYMY